MAAIDIDAIRAEIANKFDVTVEEIANSGRYSIGAVFPVTAITLNSITSVIAQTIGAHGKLRNLVIDTYQDHTYGISARISFFA
jgi:hypothetical protein